MLVVASLMLLAVLVYAIGQPGAERNHVGFQSVYLVLAAGVSLAFLTGDLFNLFVAFEMMLTASYVLLTLGGTREQVRVGHDLRRHQPARLDAVRHRARAALRGDRHGEHGRPRRQDRASSPTGVQSAFAVLLVVVFGIKAALFPLFFWLPDSYPTAPGAGHRGVRRAAHQGRRSTPSSAPRRCSSRADAGRRPCCWCSPRATMLIGVLGAIAQDDVKRILSFNIVSQIGYMVMGLGALHRRRRRRRRLLHRPPHRREDHAVPHRRPDRARRRLQPAQPASAGWCAPRRCSPCCSCSRRSAWPGSRRCRASSPSSRSSRPASRRSEYAIVAVSLLVSLLTLFVDDQDLVRGLLEPGGSSPPTPPPARTTGSAARSSWSRRPSCSSSAGSPSPSPPDRSTT